MKRRDEIVITGESLRRWWAKPIVLKEGSTARSETLRAARQVTGWAAGALALFLLTATPPDTAAQERNDQVSACLDAMKQAGLEPGTFAADYPDVCDVWPLADDFRYYGVAYGYLVPSADELEAHRTTLAAERRSYAMAAEIMVFLGICGSVGAGAVAAARDSAYRRLQPAAPPAGGPPRGFAGV